MHKVESTPVGKRNKEEQIHMTLRLKQDRGEKNGIIWAALRVIMEGTGHDLDNQDDGLKRATSQSLRNKSKNGMG